jgi:hypothetical protein
MIFGVESKLSNSSLYFLIGRWYQKEYVYKKEKIPAGFKRGNVRMPGGARKDEII